MSLTRCFNPSHRICVFSGFRRKRLALNHTLTSLRQRVSLSTAEEVSLTGVAIYIWQSSAYWCSTSPWAATSRWISAVYRLKRRGLRTDPWGTPKKTECVAERSPAYAICCVLPFRNDVGHRRTWPVSPKLRCNHSRSSGWSNAAERSSRLNNVIFCASADIRASDRTWSMVVSVEWNLLYADWLAVSRLLVAR